VTNTPGRRFLIVRRAPRATIRFILSAEDAGNLAEAFGQILEDLPSEPMK
jgi:hypothetical protein